MVDLTDSYLRVCPSDVRERYDMREVRSAAAVLASAHPDEFDEIIQVLRSFSLTRADILTPGKNEGQIARRLNKAFRDLGWREGRHVQRSRRCYGLCPTGRRASGLRTS